MKKSTRNIIFILTISILLLSLFRFILIVKIKEYAYGFVLGFTLLFSIFLLGYNKNRNSKEKNMLVALFLFALLFQVVVFVFFGLKLGFLSSSYTLGFTHFFKIVLPILLILIFSEVLRYQMIEKGRNSPVVFVYVTFFLIYLEFLIESSLYSLDSFKSWFEISAFVLFPSIMKNIFLTYIAYHYGFKPPLFYRFIMEISVFYLPIIPDTGDYLACVLNILFPFFLFLSIYSYTSNMDLHPKEEEDFSKPNKRKLYFLYGISVIFLFLYVGLMSGVFKYYFLAIGSGSMEPTILVGDMVLVEKTKNYETLEIGDVLVYKNKNKVIIHRIAEIKKENEQFIFKTKGDNNELIDNWDITEDDVIGKVRLKLKGLGYPTIWLNSLFKGGS